MWQIRKPGKLAGVEDDEQRQRALEEHRLVTVGDAGAFAKRDTHTELKVELHQRLIDLINLQALDELLGLGPLEPLLKDPTITDILVNGHDRVFVERYGVLEPSAARFKDEKHLLRVIQKIVSAVGRRID